MASGPALRPPLPGLEASARRAEVHRIPGAVTVGTGSAPGGERAVVGTQARSEDLERRFRAVLEELDVEIEECGPHAFQSGLH